MGLSCQSQAAIAVTSFATQDGGRSGCGGGGGGGGVLESFKYRELESATSSFAQENVIGRGSHGHLYRAALRDGRVVAVKRPDAGARAQEDAEAFTNEAQILSKLFSRRLVNLLGCAYDGRVTLLVLEHMENGTLHENLVPGGDGDDDDHHHDGSSFSALSWPRRVKLAIDVAKAVRALHASSPPIVHRNLRTTNVFIDRDGHARLGDFCLAKCLPKSSYSPPRRSALIPIPEIDITLHPEPVADDHDDDPGESSSSDSTTPSSDVFSFGIILLEILSGRSAQDHHHHVAGALRLLDWALPLIKHGHAMAICDPTMSPFPDSAAVQLIASVAARCVRSSTIRRPSMEEVVQSLTKASKLIFQVDPQNITSTPSRSDHPKLPGSSTPTTSRPERLIRFTTATPATSTVRSSVWTIFTRLKKKRRTLVYRLNKFLTRKLFRLRLSPSTNSYDKLKKKKRRVLINSKSCAVMITTPLKGAKVSDDDVEGQLRDRSVVDHVLHQKKSVLATGARDHHHHHHKLRRAPPPATTSSTVRFAGSSPTYHHHRPSKSKFVRL